MIVYKGISEAGFLQAALNDPPSSARRPGGWAISDQDEPYIIDLASDPVPATAVFLGGSAYSADGARYVTSDSPLGAQFIGGQAIRNDGALHITTSAPDAFLGRWGHTENGAACVNAYVRAVFEGGLVSNDVTFTRADPATYFDSTGTLQTAAANEARTTYIDGVPLLLMEGERENLLTRSEEFDHADWNKLIGGTGSNPVVTSNDTEAPDGNITADKIVFDTGANTTSSDRSIMYQSITVTDATQHAGGLWLKGESGGEEILLRHVGFGTYSKFTLTTDWQRVITTETSNSTSVTIEFGLRQSVSGLGAINSSITVYAWGAQVEEGVHESSYIATTTAAVTRAADSASLANSIIASLTEGVVYMEILSEYLTSDAARHIAELESDANNFIRAFIASGGDIDGQITSGGTSQAALAGPAHTPGTLHKVALVFGPSGFALYVDGTQEATGTGTVPSVDTLLIGAGLHGGIKTMNVEVSERSQASAEALTS